MSNLADKVQIYLGRKPNFDTEVVIQDDGNGQYIKEWNISSEKAKPTESQLDAVASEATKLFNNDVIRDKRKAAYGDIGDQLDEIFKNIDAWKTRIQKIKTDNPKE